MKNRILAIFVAIIISFGLFISWNVFSAEVEKSFLDDIKGESTDDAHADQIETIDISTPKPKPKPKPEDVKVKHDTSKAIIRKLGRE